LCGGKPTVCNMRDVFTAIFLLLIVSHGGWAQEDEIIAGGK